MDYGLLAVLVAVVVGIDVYHAFWGKPEGRVRARQSLALVAIALAGIGIWKAGSDLLTDRLGVDARLSMIGAAVVCLIPAALLYNKLSRRISGMTLEEQCRAMLERYANKGDFVAAVQQGHKLVAMNSSAENFYLLGRCYELKKDYKKAVKYYTSAVEIDAAFYMAYNNMGTSYLNLKETDRAREVLEKAYELKPEHPYIPANLAYTYACFQEIRKAEEYLEKAKANGYEDRGDEILRKIREEEKASGTENEE